MTNASSTFTDNLTDFITTTVIFGEIIKPVISKNFKGGNINNIFGSTEIDFTHADLKGVAVLNISQTFGEIKITVPAEWRVETELSQFFAVVDDKRISKFHEFSAGKILVLSGFSVFANVELKSSMQY